MRDAFRSVWLDREMGGRTTCQSILSISILFLQTEITVIKIDKKSIIHKANLPTLYEGGHLMYEAEKSYGPAKVCEHACRFFRFQLCGASCDP